MDAPVAVGGVEGLEQGADLVREQLAAPLGSADRPADPLVEAGLGHLKQFTHPRNRRELCGGALRIDELEFLGHRCSFAKCAATFFRKVFSISSSRQRRSSSRSRGPFGQFQRWFVSGVCGAVFLHPAADGRLVEPIFAGHLGNRPIRLNHELRNLVTKLRLIFLVLLRQFHSSFPDRTLLGPQSGKSEARQLPR